jgi:hypothetical protein
MISAIRALAVRYAHVLQRVAAVIALDVGQVQVKQNAGFISKK